MRAAAGAISRARARARAHEESGDDGRELGELQGGQYFVFRNLKDAWQRARSAVREPWPVWRGSRGLATYLNAKN